MYETKCDAFTIAEENRILLSFNFRINNKWLLFSAYDKWNTKKLNKQNLSLFSLKI